MATDDLHDRALDPADSEALGYLERSLASSPVWQMGTRSLQRRIDRRDPQLLNFLASAKNAPLGELEFDVLTWAITRWYQSGRPGDGRLVATVGELAQSLYGGRHGGMQYGMIREALDRLYNVSLDLTVLSLEEGDEVWRATRRRRIIQELSMHEHIRGGTPKSSSTIEIRLGSWLVDQLDAHTVAAIGWQVLRGLSGIAKRLAIYLAAHHDDFKVITAHTARLLVPITEDLYEEFGITAARERDRRASIGRAARRILETDARYSRLEINPGQAGAWVLCVERPHGARVVPLPGLSAVSPKGQLRLDS